MGEARRDEYTLFGMEGDAFNTAAKNQHFQFPIMQENTCRLPGICYAGGTVRGVQFLRNHVAVRKEGEP